MIIFENNFIPFGGYKYFNFFSILFTKSEDKLTDKDKNHERIHNRQMLELAIIGVLILFITCIFTDISLFYSILGVFLFYVWYGIEYLLIMAFHNSQHDNYHDVSLEEEAYLNDDNLEYLKNRKWFNWLKYIKPKSYNE